MKRLFLLFSLILLSIAVIAQDFKCQVSVNSNAISGSNKNRYNALQQDLYQFINDRKWCNYNLKNSERIECSILINLTSVSGDVINGTMTVQLQRPVFNASYKTTVLNFQDKNVQFTYEEGSPLEYSESVNMSQLTSLIAFYLNLFLAVDFDTFSLNGGSEYYTKCQNIVNLNQNATESGWKVFEQGSGQSNRYWIIENFTNGQYNKIHEFLYNYHRLGLDIMSETPDAGRAAILESLRILQQVSAQRSGLAIIQLITQAKISEIIEIFKEGTPTEKNQMISIMKQVDPSNTSKYEAVNRN